MLRKGGIISSKVLTKKNGIEINEVGLVMETGYICIAVSSSNLKIR